MNCKKCGAPMVPGQIFCSSCDADNSKEIEDVSYSYNNVESNNYDTNISNDNLYEDKIFSNINSNTYNYEDNSYSDNIFNSNNYYTNENMNQTQIQNEYTNYTNDNIETENYEKEEKQESKKDKNKIFSVLLIIIIIILIILIIKYSLSYFSKIGNNEKIGKNNMINTYKYIRSEINTKMTLNDLDDIVCSKDNCYDIYNIDKDNYELEIKDITDHYNIELTYKNKVSLKESDCDNLIDAYCGTNEIIGRVYKESN